MFKIMQGDILLNPDPAILHWIEFVAGNSNDIVLSHDQAVLAKAMLREAEECTLMAQEESLEKQSHIDRLRTALAPHKMVPTEILSAIFQHFSGFLYICPFLPEYTSLRLLRVCSRWRSILKSEPSLYNNGAFSLGARAGKDDLPEIMFWIDNYVVTSRPISLMIWTHHQFDPEVYHLLIGSQHNLIRRLDIDQSAQFLAMPVHSFPLLEKLHIQVHRDDLCAFNRSSCFVGMKNLRFLMVEFFVPIDEGILTQGTVPWGHLTDLRIVFMEKGDRISVPEAVEVLKQCTKLRQCVISVNNAYTVTPLTILLPDLSLLVLLPRRRDYNDEFSLLDCIIAPALESLTVRMSIPSAISCSPATCFKPDIGPLIRRSGCSLHTLILEHYYHLSTDTDLELELLPLLHTLQASNVVFSDETLHKVVDNILLPNIKILSLAIPHIETLELLTKLVETKSSTSDAVPTCLDLAVKLLDSHVIVTRKLVYVKACLKRIKACGSRMVLRCENYTKTLSTDNIDRVWDYWHYRLHGYG